MRQIRASEPVSLGVRPDARWANKDHRSLTLLSLLNMKRYISQKRRSNPIFEKPANIDDIIIFHNIHQMMFISDIGHQINSQSAAFAGFQPAWAPLQWCF